VAKVICPLSEGAGAARGFSSRLDVFSCRGMLLIGVAAGIFRGGRFERGETTPLTLRGWQ